MPEFWSFCVFPLLAGIGVGFSEVSAMTYSTEINKIEYRARFIVYFNAFFFAGAISSVCCAFGLVPGLQPANWRILVALGGIPAFISAILSFIYLKESPRHLLAHKRFDELKTTLNFMLNMNKKGEVTSEEFENLKE